MLCKPHFHRSTAVGTPQTDRSQQRGVHGVVTLLTAAPEQLPRAGGWERRTCWVLHMELGCISDGAMVGMAQALAILLAEVSDKVRCPWHTKPERLPIGTAPSFPSLPSLQGFNPPDGVSQLSWLFPSPPILGESLSCLLLPTWKDTDPLCHPRQRQGDAAVKTHLEAHQRSYRL